MIYSKYKYAINDTFEEKEPDRPFILDRIETKLHLTRKEVEEKLVYKSENGECEIKYNGEERKGIIMSVNTNGDYVIGIFKENKS
jgi:hypothetical protein